MDAHLRSVPAEPGEEATLAGDAPTFEELYESTFRRVFTALCVVTAIATRRRRSPRSLPSRGRTLGSRRLARGSDRVRVPCLDERVPQPGDRDDPPPRPRDADDVVDGINELLTVSGVEQPYVVVGASFGGMVVTYYASLVSRWGGGVVLLDVPAPSTSSRWRRSPRSRGITGQPGALDIVQEFEGRFARKPVSFEAPLIVVTATEGQSSVEDQRVWLDGTPDAQQIELAGSRDVWLDDPVGSAAAVLQLVEPAT